MSDSTSCGPPPMTYRAERDSLKAQLAEQERIAADLRAMIEEYHNTSHASPRGRIDQCAATLCRKYTEALRAWEAGKGATLGAMKCAEE